MEKIRKIGNKNMKMIEKHAKNIIEYYAEKKKKKMKILINYAIKSMALRTVSTEYSLHKSYKIK
jgi:hypothetical protein